MPLFSLESKVFVSMSDPQNIEAQQMIYFATGMNQLRNVSGSKDDIIKLIDKYSAGMALSSKRSRRSTPANRPIWLTTGASPVSASRRETLLSSNWSMNTSKSTFRKRLRYPFRAAGRWIKNQVQDRRPVAIDRNDPPHLDRTGHFPHQNPLSNENRSADDSARRQILHGGQ